MQHEFLKMRRTRANDAFVNQQLIESRVNLRDLEYENVTWTCSFKKRNQNLEDSFGALVRVLDKYPPYYLSWTVNEMSGFPKNLI